MDDRMDCMCTNNGCGLARSGASCDRSDNNTGGGAGVACLVERKVFDACSKRHCFNDMRFKFMIPRGTLDDYTFVDVAFGKAKVAKCDGYPFFTPKTDCTATYRGVVLVPLYAYLKEKCSKKIIMVPLHPVNNGTVCPDNCLAIPFEYSAKLNKRYVLQGRFEPYAESYGQYCKNISLDGTVLRMSVGIFVIIKVIGDTQLKIAHQGNCEIPAECTQDCSNFCEDFMDADITSFPNFYTR